MRIWAPLVILATSVGGLRSDDFSKVGSAFLQKHCIACHGDKKKSAGITLHQITDTASLLKNRKVWQAVERVLAAGEMPPREKPRPTVEELTALRSAAERVFVAADKNAKPDPGRITVRRLNRTEYANTVRDLVGIDFNPSEDFPADDIGYGFDNIGDVLSVSPILMERYLSAAEAIVQRAIVPIPPKPPQRFVSCKYLQPGTDPNKIGKFRPITEKNLMTPYTLTLGGEYVFRFRAFATSPGTPLQADVRIDGRSVKTFDIPHGDEKSTKVWETPMKLPKGNFRIAVEVLNPGKDDQGNGRSLSIEWFNLEGPADTRPETQQTLLAHDPMLKGTDRTRFVLNRFVSRAYRRPATPDEVTRLVKLVESVEDRKQPWEAGIQLAMQAVLVSPKFLFRLEMDDRPDTADPHPIDEYQLASRLSYFLWSSMPDDELFRLAEKKQLTAQLDAQITRMLQDPKSDSLVDNFVMQWLQLKRLPSFAPDAVQFPQFSEQIRSAMIHETRLFFQELIRQDRSILDIIDGNYTYLNGRLGSFYGIVDNKGSAPMAKGKRPLPPPGKKLDLDKWERVELPPDHVRGGILTHASILTVTSNPTRTSPVKRGKWVLEQILGTPPPPPPPDVPELKDDAATVATGSLRKRMEEHRKNPACANCHQKMDDLGFAFENFNAVGMFRTKDGEFPIDSAGVLPDGKAFKDVQELRAILKEKKDLVARNLAEKLMTFGLGRGLEWYDRKAVDKVVDGTKTGEYKFSALVREIVRSDPFRMRRGKTQTGTD